MILDEVTDYVNKYLVCNRIIMHSFPTWRKIMNITKTEERISYPLLKITSSTRSLRVRDSLTGSKHSCITSRAILSLLWFSVKASISWLSDVIGFNSVQVRLSTPTGIGLPKILWSPKNIWKNEMCQMWILTQ